MEQKLTERIIALRNRYDLVAHFGQFSYGDRVTIKGRDATVIGWNNACNRCYAILDGNDDSAIFDLSGWPMDFRKECLTAK